jgi:ABC-type sugar transport system substrate-binding protein
MKQMGVKNAVILNQEIGNVALDQRTKGFRDVIFEGLSITSGASGDDRLPTVS